MPGFVYPCKCREECSETEAFCSMTKATRNFCKRCRYNKCKSAGMAKGWVLSAHIPRSQKVKASTKHKIAMPEFIHYITNKYSLMDLIDDEVR